MAQCNLGTCYEHGSGVAKDEKKAVECFQLSAAQGDADAQCNLGNRYLDGSGVAKDEKKAVEYFQLSAAQGDAPMLSAILASVTSKARASQRTSRS